MRSRGPISILFVITIVAAVAYFFAVFRQLPPQVITRFAADGQALQTVSKAVFALLYWGLLALCTLYFLAARFRSLPDRYLRFIPNHDHWLAPERRADSARYVSGLLVWLAFLTLLVFLGNLILLSLANTGQGFAGLSTLLNFFDTIYLSCIFFLVIAFRRRFALPKA